MFDISGHIENFLGGKLSFSQEGEDVLLDYYFEGRKTGLYVDVGAHHPIRFSNTYRFYRKGWKGINIDATPGSMKLFEKIRPRDINLEIGVSNLKGVLPFYQFEESALNTFDQRLARYYIGLKYKLLTKKNVKVSTLKSILNKYVPDGLKIDFMTIDVEGFDFKVLESNDWIVYRPSIVSLELLSRQYLSLKAVESNSITKYLKTLGYTATSKLNNTVFYKI